MFLLRSMFLAVIACTRHLTSHGTYFDARSTARLIIYAVLPLSQHFSTTAGIFSNGFPNKARYHFIGRKKVTRRIIHDNATASEKSFISGNDIFSLLCLLLSSQTCRLKILLRHSHTVPATHHIQESYDQLYLLPI